MKFDNKNQNHQIQLFIRQIVFLNTFSILPTTQKTKNKITKTNFREIFFIYSKEIFTYHQMINQKKPHPILLKMPK